MGMIENEEVNALLKRCLESRSDVKQLSPQSQIVQAMYVGSMRACSGVRDSSREYLRSKPMAVDGWPRKMEGVVNVKGNCRGGSRLRDEKKAET